MWLVVKPTVGIPVFFLAIFTVSLLIHYSVLSNSSWFPAFLNGGPKAAATASVAPSADSSVVVASR